MEGGSDGTGNDSDSHDAAYGRAHVPYGAEGAATYSKITLGCFDVVMKARDMIDDSIQALGLPADSLATVRIADFGSADGGPLMPMALHIRSTIPAGCELEVGDTKNDDTRDMSMFGGAHMWALDAEGTSIPVRKNEKPGVIVVS